MQPPPFELAPRPIGPDGQFVLLWKRFFNDQQNAISGGAPDDAAYLVATADASLPNRVNLGLLASGYLKITVAAGVATPSSTASIPAADIAAGTAGINISGSAAKLTTARTIAGVSFDGTANIAIASTGLSDTASLAYLANQNNFTDFQIITTPNTSSFSLKFLGRASDNQSGLDLRSNDNSTIYGRLIATASGLNFSIGNLGVGITPATLFHVGGQVRIDDGIAAPATSVGIGIVNFYGTSATNFLGQPNAWLRINISGTSYKIPCYN